MVYEKMTAIADAIRLKTGGTEALTLEDMAAAIPEVYNAAERQCAAKHFVAVVTGSGTSEMAISVPFDPDAVFVICHSAYAASLANGSTGYWMDLRFNRRNAARYSGYFMAVPPNADRTNTRVSASTALEICTYSDGMLRFNAVNATLQKYVWRSDLQYLFTAVQYSDKTDAELLAEEIALLPDATGGTVEYSLFRVNEIFETASGANDGSTSAAWAALVATKPKWTFTLV